MKSISAHTKSKSAHRIVSIAFIVGVSFIAATAPAKANGNWESYQEASRVAQHAYNTSISAIQGNVSIIQQIGNNNQASVVQSRSASYQLGNFAYIKQLGDNNQASISQSNGRNIGIIVQVGNDHAANIVQSGNNFQAKINQVGFGSDITLSQSGSGQQRISVEQQNYSGNALPVAIDTY